MLARLLVAMMPLAAAACDDGGSGRQDPLDVDALDSTTGPGDAPPVLVAVCGYLERCPQRDFALRYGDRDECAQLLDLLVSCRVVDGEPERIEPLAAVDDPAATAACIAWLESATCDARLLANPDRVLATADGPHPCADLVAALEPGHVDDDDFGERSAAGESCEDLPCGLGLHCTLRGNNDAGEPLCRLCEKPGAQGEPCTTDFLCATDLVCDLLAGTCQPLPGEGEPCLNNSQCIEGLVCLWESDGSTTRCAPAQPDGAPCTRSDECLSGFCNGVDRVCDPGGEQGDPCELDPDCRESVCNEPTQTCLPYREPGEPCIADLQCKHGQTCAPNGRCAQVEGSACASNLQCQSGYCDPASGSCAATKAGVGEPCQYNEDCASGGCDRDATLTCYATCGFAVDGVMQSCPAQERCESGRCVAPSPDGAPCSDDDECLSLWCDPFADHCATKPGVGDPCTADHECEPQGYCDNDTVCVAKKGEGEACSDDHHCALPYACGGGRCTRLALECRAGRPGERCTFFRVCEDGAYCDPADGFTCKRGAALGAPCSGFASCPDGLFCDAGGCQPLRAGGQPCSSDNECASDDCDSQQCQPVSDDGPQCVLE